MPKTIPLIRSAALVPMLTWMQRNNRPVEARLAEADLGYVAFDNPLQTIPVHNVALFVRIVARDEGPDIGCRVISDASLFELALIGKVALGARTPRDAMMRVAAALPYHSSHEHIRLSPTRTGLAVTEGWTVAIEPEALHIFQQYVACLMDVVCRLSEPRGPAIAHVEMIPHPTAGLAHLAGRFGDRISAARSKALTLHIASDVADRPFRHSARDHSAQLLASGIQPLNGAVGLSQTVRVIIAAMLEAGQPTVERLALASGMSLRTLQRRLMAEGTSFTDLLEDVRRDQALQHIARSDTTLNAVSATLGFARQSALTRAVRRWTGQAPSSLRSAGQQQ